MTTDPTHPLLPDLTGVWQQTLGWQPTPEQQLKFQQLYHQILTGNQQLNLTRITEPLEFWEKHLWDSLSGIKRFFPPPPSPLPTPYTAIDIGTGAGFPGVPIAIVQPTWQLTLLDSTRKKMQFLQTMLQDLQITNAVTCIERVEAIGQQRQHRQVYDLALIRAVAPAAVCAEYALPLLKIGGMAVLYRGQWTALETETLAPVVAHLGGVIDAVETFQTPLTTSDRTCLYLRKTAATPPEFPRSVGTPTQKPLA